MALRYKICPKCRSKNVVQDGCKYACNNCNYTWDREEIIENAYKEIKRITVSIGGYFGPNFTVDLNLNEKQVTWSKRDDTEESIKKIINDKRIGEVIDNLKVINLLNWKRSYIDSDVLDGTGWWIDIETENMRMHKYGRNHYPAEWNEFCKLIKKITRKPFY